MMRHIAGIALSFTLLFGQATFAGEAPRTGAIADLRITKGAGVVAEAWFADPTTRYTHFVLGSKYEPQTLVVRLRGGGEMRYTLPEEFVFEDRQPRLADLDGDGVDEIVVVRSSMRKGAALVVFGVSETALRLVAETPPTGRANTWLNPAGIADFDGDGRNDVAYVQMPHVLGRLRVVTLRQGQLVEIATVEGTSNHQIGSPNLGLSAVADFDRDGVADLIIPSLDRRTLRILRFKGGVRELGHQPLPRALERDLRLERSDNGDTVVADLGESFLVRLTPPRR